MRWSAIFALLFAALSVRFGRTAAAPSAAEHGTELAEYGICAGTITLSCQALEQDARIRAFGPKHGLGAAATSTVWLAEDVPHYLRTLAMAARRFTLLKRILERNQRDTEMVERCVAYVPVPDSGGK
jgi:hypothetical protein